jgi:hypothetical protein
MSDNKLVLNTSLIQSMGSFRSHDTTTLPASREEKPYRNTSTEVRYDEIQDPKRAHKESKNHLHRKSSGNRDKLSKKHIEHRNEEVSIEETPPVIRVIIEKPLLCDSINHLEFGSHQTVIPIPLNETRQFPGYKQAFQSKYYTSYACVAFGLIILFSRDEFYYLDLATFLFCAVLAVLLCPSCLEPQVAPTLMGASSSTMAVLNGRNNDSPFDKLRYTARHFLPVYEELARDLVQNNRSVTIDAHSLKRITAEAQQLINKNYSRESKVDNGVLRNTILFVSCVIQTYQEGISYACITPKRIGSMPWE